MGEKLYHPRCADCVHKKARSKLKSDSGEWRKYYDKHCRWCLDEIAVQHRAVDNFERDGSKYKVVTFGRTSSLILKGTRKRTKRKRRAPELVDMESFAPEVIE